MVSRRGRGGTSIPPPPAPLPLVTVGSSLGDAELVLRTEIGDGGMGVVFSAWQRSLGREVAVKRLVPEAQGDEAFAALIREARVTGSLEHPSVVPVHALGSDAHGRPVMVMRRVHGTPWGSLLRGEDRRAKKGDALETHLEILLQVCNAVRFAHSKGVIHGDLKPDNVMLGAYGEVYVLDWGAAMATRRDDPRGLPFAGDVRTVQGTPAYMAPEMVGSGTEISERTDVYLLGAVLHEILVGAPPHAGESLYDAMKGAFVSRPYAYPKEVPRELARVCHQAMDAAPARRYASVDDLRLALAEHLTHRASIALVAETNVRLGELLAAVEAAPEGPAGETIPDIARGREVYQLYAECRFGYQHALRTWAGNEEARDGMERALTAMVTFAVGAGDAQAAELLAGGLTGAHTELRARIAELAARARAEGAELARLRSLARDLDTSTHARPRQMFLGVIGALGIVNVVVFERAGPSSPLRIALAVGMPLTLWIVAGLGAVAGRRRIFATRASRVLVGGVLMALGATTVNRALNLLVRRGALSDVLWTDLLVFAAVAAMMTLAVHRRFAVQAIAFLAAGIASHFFPEQGAIFLSLSLLVFTAGSVLTAGQRNGDS